jgi:NADH-quinone oxidoreductase subunit A
MIPDHLLAPYGPVLIFFMCAIGLAVVLVGLSYILSPKPKPNAAKISAFECGFDPFETPRHPIRIGYYLVAILFIIFDLEVAFLFPWSLVLTDIGWAGFGSMMIFLTILTVGFVYEWRKGALEWQ